MKKNHWTQIIQDLVIGDTHRKGESFRRDIFPQPIGLQFGLYIPKKSGDVLPFNYPSSFRSLFIFRKVRRVFFRICVGACEFGSRPVALYFGEGREELHEDEISACDLRGEGGESEKREKGPTARIRRS